MNILESKRNCSFVSDDVVHKRPRIIEVPWLTVDEWQEKVNNVFKTTSFSEKLDNVKKTMVEKVVTVKGTDRSYTVDEQVIWLDLGEDCHVHIGLRSSEDTSIFKCNEALGVGRLGFNILVHSQAQNEFEESEVKSDELKEKLQKSMSAREKPLLSLQWDLKGEVLEVVWLQASKSFDCNGTHYPGINGSVLRSLVELFTELLPPSKMTVLADQAEIEGQLIRANYFYRKDWFPYGPGYYGSWGFIPSNCWMVETHKGNYYCQSRDLYYSAVEYLRRESHNPERNKGMIEMAEKIVLQTEIWEKRPEQQHRNGYINFLCFTDLKFETLFKGKEVSDIDLVAEVLGNPQDTCWLI